ncbi:hypothetical protein COCOBI_11-5570 [Coccomyxa sp. Obi]|nr:hypothetical protein COCOBI_11-5570 [Coccomyxa sp. Obi]
MDSFHNRVAAAAALVLCLVIGRAAGQTTVQTTIGFFDVTPVTVYGQAPTYRISFPLPTSSPAPTQGNVSYRNDTTQIDLFTLAGAQFNPECTGTSCANVYTFTGTPLAAGQYKEVNVVYSGATTNGVTFNPTSSGGQGLADVTAQVLPASVQFFSSFTPFTLANFTAAINVNLTNLNATNKEPAGSAYAAFYKDPAGANTLIGNYSLTLLKVSANSVKLVLPSSFDAASLFTTTGAYRLIETYFPTPNFTQPQPLAISFTVTRSTPAPPPPPPVTPGTPPPPPPPPGTPSTGQKTTIALSIFFNYAKRRALLSEEVAAGPAAALSSYGNVEGYGGGYSGSGYGGCSRSGSLTFVAAVSGTAGVPADGTVTFTLAPSATPLGTVPVVPTAGSAVAKLTVPFIDGATYGYGTHSATAVYSGSTNGAFLPAQVTVNFVIPDCQKINAKEDIVNHVVDTVHEILISDDTYSGNHGYAPSTPVQVAGK